MRIIVCLVMLSYITPLFASGDLIDWTYELGGDARLRYIEKRVMVPCSAIDKLLVDHQLDRIYMVIRDAALFRDRECSSAIQRNRYTLVQSEQVNDAIIFYQYVMGDKSKLRALTARFDSGTRESGDHWTVELFGYLQDWDVTGVRLVKLARDADGVGAEALCSAIAWRRFLYGENDFERNWYRIGKELKIPIERLRNRAIKCLR